MNPITEMQQGAADILAADPFFDDIPVITEKIKDIENQVDQAVGRIAVCCLVVTPVAIISHGNMPVYFEPVNLVIRTFENPTVNTTGKGALDITLQAIGLLHLVPPVSPAFETLVCKGYRLGNDPRWLSYDAIFETKGGIVVPIPVVADPVVAYDSGLGSFSITCATPHASIFYSTGDPYPSPRSGTFYAGPVTMPKPVTVKARAWLPGYHASKYIKQTFS